ncbi:hypothetical protein [Micromonospora sp. NPDC000442]|uniref:hypothetical protein n=1 Tax=Micromonospora sp. NPDC000442 TaxID=3364217 RepID=UPI003679FB4C
MSTDTVTASNLQDLAPQRNKRRKTRRRVAKGLAYVSLAITAVLVLSEPWLLLPLVMFVAALSLWD